jgi:hypothetical protein
MREREREGETGER